MKIELDRPFVDRLVYKIGRAIFEESKVDGIAMLRTGETVKACVEVAAVFLAMSPDAMRSPERVHEFMEKIERRLVKLAGQCAEADAMKDWVIEMMQGK